MPIELHSTPNDLYFQEQYYLHNTGQTGGVNDADIDAPEAWDMTKGSSSITIAVLDEGGMAHEDLPASRIVPGYDYFYLDNDPSPGGNEAHGMAAAGIVAATHNSIGIAGVAPNCKIMPIRIFDEYGVGTSIDNVADAIDYAWQNGADILSNSWGYNSCDPNDPLLVPIRYAINRALYNGRNGKGSVVVFSAGNTANRSSGNYGCIAFPANLDGVITVGASDKSDNIWNYSPQSDTIDVVAPSGNIGLQIFQEIVLQGDVWSLDIPGDPGYNPGDFGTGPPTYYWFYSWSAPGGDPSPPGNYTA
ncbi:MAG: S8 family serine peptidase, partial [Aliifodinibius sp.]|nr:S8 family serine peptidase [Fodinibius sp.]NIW47459.1 S8 family serine peptidase [Gammaproteobacteria bacterium]NIY28756.1 S8 family serine peptidase [Fodinibius sp.]